MIIWQTMSVVNSYRKKILLFFPFFLLYNEFMKTKEEYAMLISSRGRYALQMMLDLAEHQSDGYISLKTIAERQEISEKYLEAIAVLLVRSGLLDGVRGKGGGYRLTKAPDQYAVGDVLRLTEKSLAPVSCWEKVSLPALGRQSAACCPYGRD